MNDVVTQKCFNHRHREAAARCPQCERYFCRECVTEHDDRVICAGCLRKIAAPRRRVAPRLAGLLAVLRLAAGIMVLWLFFYYIGQGLLRLPSSFHEGTLWRELPWEKP